MKIDRARKVPRKSWNVHISFFFYYIPTVTVISRIVQDIVNGTLSAFEKTSRRAATEFPLKNRSQSRGQHNEDFSRSFAILTVVSPSSRFLGTIDRERLSRRTRPFNRREQRGTKRRDYATIIADDRRIYRSNRFSDWSKYTCARGILCIPRVTSLWRTIFAIQAVFRNIRLRN